MDKMQEAFVNWVKSAPQWYDGCEHLELIDGRYKYDTTESAWLGWQAAFKSRDAEIAELKEKQHYLYSISLLGMGKEDRLKEKLQTAREALTRIHISGTSIMCQTIAKEALAQIEDE